MRSNMFADPRSNTNSYSHSSRHLQIILGLDVWLCLLITQFQYLNENSLFTLMKFEGKWTFFQLSVDNLVGFVLCQPVTINVPIYYYRLLWNETYCQEPTINLSNSNTSRQNQISVRAVQNIFLPVNINSVSYRRTWVEKKTFWKNKEVH